MTYFAGPKTGMVLFVINGRVSGHMKKLNFSLKLAVQIQLKKICADKKSENRIPTF